MSTYYNNVASAKLLCTTVLQGVGKVKDLSGFREGLSFCVFGGVEVP